ncbi:hypothetical protein GCM10028895_09430 [Pontibacter rugosus]
MPGAEVFVNITPNLLNNEMTAPSEAIELITWQHFEQTDIRVGTIVAADEFPEARRPAYKLTVDLGPLGIKKLAPK